MMASTAIFTSWFLLTSATSGKASPRCCSMRLAVSRVDRSLQSITATRAASCPNSSAVARPIPEPPPVTITTFPADSLMGMFRAWLSTAGRKATAGFPPPVAMSVLDVEGGISPVQLERGLHHPRRVSKIAGLKACSSSPGAGDAPEPGARESPRPAERRSIKDVEHLPSELSPVALSVAEILVDPQVNVVQVRTNQNVAR